MRASSVAFDVAVFNATRFDKVVAHGKVIYMYRTVPNTFGEALCAAYSSAAAENSRVFADRPFNIFRVVG